MILDPNQFNVINEMCSNQSNLRIFLIQFNLIQSFTGQLTRSDVITVLLADTLDAENQTLSVSEVQETLVLCMQVTDTIASIL